MPSSSFSPAFFHISSRGKLGRREKIALLGLLPNRVISGMEMEGCSEKEKGCPQLLHLIHQGERAKNREEGRSHGSSDEKKLELRLGLPGQEWPWKHTTTKTRDESSLLSLPCFSSMPPFPTNNNGSCAQKSPSIFHRKTQNNQQQHVKPPLFLHTLPAIPKETAQKPSCTENEMVKLLTVEKQPFSPSANNGTQKRTAPPVVGWPPIRSSRRIIASASSSKTSPEESANGKTGSEKAGEKGLKGLFVKINMDGVPVGRKVDLSAYDSYEKLSSAVDQLFRGLLAAKNDYCGGGMEKSTEKVLGGSGEYTLVYEDNEGDRMLVGDVPWNMFVSGVKRLRVLKSSELHALILGGSKGDKMAT